jgi:hypothetical protein
MSGKESNSMEWLKELFDRVTSIFPRIHIITAYEAGVMFTLGKHVKPMPPGL